MHVVFAIYNANADGAVLSTSRRQAEYMAEMGHEVTLISNACPHNWKNVCCEHVDAFQSRFWKMLDRLLVRGGRLLLRGCPGQRLGMDGVLPQALFPTAVSHRIACLHERHPVDCCICCQHVMALGLRRLKKALGIPFLLVSHGDIFLHPRGAFSMPMTMLYRRAAIVSYRTASHIVAVCQQIRSRAIACGALPESVTVVPNGIDLREIGGDRPTPLSRHAENEILFVGRLAREKAPDVLLRAVARLEHVSFYLRIVGTGSMEHSLKDLAAQLNLNDKCEFVGHVPRNELGGYYARADMMALPSVAEAHPVVTLEAQICGVPVVASNVGGVAEVIEDGKNGILVPPGNVDALSEAIRRLCADRDLRAKMAVRTREKAKDFAWPLILDRFHGTVVEVARQKQEKKGSKK